MTSPVTQLQETQNTPRWSYITLGYILCAVYSFLFAIDLLGLGLGALAGPSASQWTSATDNPFIGLFIGLLVTAILQSSSTTTSLAVAAVAAGSLSLENAIPMILGANIGTTITSTIVAFGFITKGHEFRKATSAAMIHSMFNILGVILLFPLELTFRPLQRVSEFISSCIPVSTSGNPRFWIGQSFDFLGNQLLTYTNAWVITILSVFLLFGSIKLLARLLYMRLVGKQQEQFRNIVFKSPTRAFGSGLFITSVVQSSSLTTSLLVPIVATGKVKLARAFYFMMGANIGTTITAILAALLRSEAAMSLAIVHFLFNVSATLLYVCLPWLGKLPLFLAERLGYLMFRYRVAAFAYITLAFFVIPFTLIYFSKSKTPEKPLIESVKKVHDP